MKENDSRDKNRVIDVARFRVLQPYSVNCTAAKLGAGYESVRQWGGGPSVGVP